MTIAERTSLGAFSQVDAAPEAAALIPSLDDQPALPAIQRLRAAAEPGSEQLRPGPPFTTMAASAERAGALTADEAQTWLAQPADAGQRGGFFWAVTMFAVAGARPWTTRQYLTSEREGAAMSLFAVTR